MVVLLNTLIVISDSSITYFVNVVCIVQSVMAEVVANAANQNTQQVKTIQTCKLQKIALCENNKKHLENIRTMNIVVVLNIPTITHINFTKEFCQFNFIE